MLALWKESYDKPRQHIKKQRHHFANKGPYSQSYGFPSIHVWMWDLDHKGWVPKNWCCWIMVLEKTLESLLDCKELKPVNPYGNEPWIFIERTDAKALILSPPEDKSWLTGKRPWCWGRFEGKKRRGWQRMRWSGSITNVMDMNLSKFQGIVEDRGAWWAIFMGSQRWTWLRDTTTIQQPAGLGNAPHCTLFWRSTEHGSIKGSWGSCFFKFGQHSIPQIHWPHKNTLPASILLELVLHTIHFRLHRLGPYYFKKKICSNLYQRRQIGSSESKFNLQNIICKLLNIASTHFLDFGHSVVSHSLRPHGLQYASLPSTSPTPGV